MTLGKQCGLLSAVTLVLISVPSSGQKMEPVQEEQLDSLKAIPSCVPSAPVGYPEGQCVVSIDRSSPVSPPPVLVPPGTKVFVRVTKTRPNEIVLFSLATTRITPPDVAGAAVKNIITPLQSLVFTQGNYHFDAAAHPDDIDVDQEAISKVLEQRKAEIRHATAALTCLSNYQVLETDFMCSQADLLDRDSFTKQEKEAEQTVEGAARFWSPMGELKDLDNRIQERMKKCLTDADAITDGAARAARHNGCLNDANRHMSNQAVLNSFVSDTQKAQSALLVSLQALREWLTARKEKQDVVAYKFTSSRLNNMTVTISGQEVVNKTSSPIASVAIDTQNTNWVISTGILFSNLKFHTFSNAPVIMNGQPVLDPGGKVTTVVTRTDTSPSVVAPTFLVSYRIPQLSRTTWENKCRGGCGFLLSGGVGANLTSKSADFDGGPSFQIGGVLLTPTVHFGRENRLTNGVAVGQKLGSSPPSPLPTQNVWVKKFGIGITYALPIP